MVAELLGLRSAGGVFAVFVIGGDFRKLVAIGAPTALEREGVHVKHHHAPAQVAVRAIEFASRFVKANLFDLTHDHRRRRRILGAKRGHRRRPCRRVGSIAATPAATLAAQGCDRTGSSRSWTVRCALGSASFASSAARLALRDARHFGQDFAGLWIVFSDRIHSVDGVPDVDEPFAVYGHAVPFGRIEGTDDVAVLVEVNHCGWRNATLGGGWIQHRIVLRAIDVSRAIEHPDVVILIDSQSCDSHHPPLVGQGQLGPVGIEFVVGRGLRLSERRAVITRHKSRAERREFFSKVGYGCA